MGCHAFGVHAGIGPAGAMQGGFRIADQRQRPLDLFLNGVAVLLSLPAAVVGAVKGNQQFDGSHWRFEFGSFIWVQGKSGT